jgi:hypothetical protein
VAGSEVVGWYCDRDSWLNSGVGGNEPAPPAQQHQPQRAAVSATPKPL